MSNLIRKKDVLNIIDSAMRLQCGCQVDIACNSLKKSVAGLLTVNEKDIRNKAIDKFYNEIKAHMEIVGTTYLEDIAEIAEYMKEGRI